MDDEGCGDMLKKLILDDFDRDYGQNKAREKQKNSPAPLAKSETFEAPLDQKSPVTNHDQLTSGKTKQSLKLKLTKFLAPSVLTSNQPGLQSPPQQPLITTSASLMLKKTPPNKPVANTNTPGILKSFFNTKSSPRSPRDEPPKPPIRKKIAPNLVLDLSNSSRTNSTNSSTSSSSASSLEDSFENSTAIDKNNNNNFPGNSFNALNLANSPRLSRNSRRAKLNLKRQQNEEKRIEKQRKDQRLRTKQELQRKLDEIAQRFVELERDGNHLEEVIGRFDKKSKNDGRRIKLEQELFNIIHQKNVLTRCENKLNIQGRALTIEDKLGECQQTLRDTMNIPETEKTIEQIETEKKIVEQIVGYIEEKNQLVEQLESLRVMERDEDSETINSYSSNYYNLEVGEAEIMSKFEPYADII